MTGRRAFLRSLVATAAGVLVSGDVLELLADPRRRVFASAWPELVSEGVTDLRAVYGVPWDTDMLWDVEVKRGRIDPPDDAVAKAVQRFTVQKVWAP